MLRIAFIFVLCVCVFILLFLFKNSLWKSFAKGNKKKKKRRLPVLPFWPDQQTAAQLPSLVQLLPPRTRTRTRTPPLSLSFAAAWPRPSALPLFLPISLPHWPARQRALSFFVDASRAGLNHGKLPDCDFPGIFCEEAKPRLIKLPNPPRRFPFASKPTNSCPSRRFGAVWISPGKNRRHRRGSAPSDRLWPSKIVGRAS